jgi:AcrR family transcriptional regulator
MTPKRWATPMLRADRRKQLLAVASQIITADGLSALTMAKLSERANIAKPVVYKHFANRNQVAIALLEIHFEALRAYYEQRLPKIATLGDYITTVVEAAFAFESVSDAPVRKMIDGFSAGDDINQICIEQELSMRVQWMKLLTMLHVPPDVSTIAASIIHGMVRASIYNFANKYQTEYSRIDRDLAKKTLIRMLMGNLQALTGFDGDLAAKALDFNEPPGAVFVKVR